MDSEKGENKIKEIKGLEYWKDRDISLDPLVGKSIAIIGYGRQGRAQACNLKDSGLDVIIGLRTDSKSKDLAIADGHKVTSIAEACSKAEIVHVLIPDIEQGNIYSQDIAPYLSKNKVICFSHGASIHWRWIQPPSNVDVIMVAPKGPGQKVRELFTDGFGIPSLVAVYQDYSGNALNTALAISKGIGSSRAAVFLTDFKEETETDCFGEQVDLCGGVQGLVTSSFETLVNAGYRPEIAYFECLHELKMIVDLVSENGIAGMYEQVSETARYGGLTRSPLIIDSSTKTRMQEILNDIQSEKFAKELVEVNTTKEDDYFDKLVKETRNHPIEKIGNELRNILYGSPFSSKQGKMKIILNPTNEINKKKIVQN